MTGTGPEKGDLENEGDLSKSEAPAEKTVDPAGVPEDEADTSSTEEEEAPAEESTPKPAKKAGGRSKAAKDTWSDEERANAYLELAGCPLEKAANQRVELKVKAGTAGKAKGQAVQMVLEQEQENGTWKLVEKSTVVLDDVGQGAAVRLLSQANQPGSYRITATADGYREASQMIEVIAADREAAPKTQPPPRYEAEVRQDGRVVVRALNLDEAPEQLVAAARYCKIDHNNKPRRINETVARAPFGADGLAQILCDTSQLHGGDYKVEVWISRTDTQEKPFKVFFAPDMVTIPPRTRVVEPTATPAVAPPVATPRVEPETPAAHKEPVRKSVASPPKEERVTGRISDDRFQNIPGPEPKGETAGKESLKILAKELASELAAEINKGIAQNNQPTPSAPSQYPATPPPPTRTRRAPSASVFWGMLVILVVLSIGLGALWFDLPYSVQPQSPQATGAAKTSKQMKLAETWGEPVRVGGMAIAPDGQINAILADGELVVIPREQLFVREDAGRGNRIYSELRENALGEKRLIGVIVQCSGEEMPLRSIAAQNARPWLREVPAAAHTLSEHGFQIHEMLVVNMPVESLLRFPGFHPPLNSGTIPTEPDGLGSNTIDADKWVGNE